MEITKTKVENKRERDIIANSIMNTQFLKDITPFCKETYFVSPHSKTIYRWCFEYYSNYAKAPQKDIQDIYIMYRSGMKQNDADLIGTMLSSLSDEYMEPGNYEYLLKVSVDYLRERSIDVLMEDIKKAKDRKDLVEAEKLIGEYGRVSIQKKESLHLFDDPDAIVDVFNTEDAELFRFSNAWGALVGPVKEKDLILISARKGVGKSFILQKFAVQAMLSQVKVLFVSLEMDMDQVRRRIYSELMVQAKETKKVKLPYFYKDTEDYDEKWKIDFEDHQLNKYHPSREDVVSFMNEFKSYFPKTDLRILSFPAKSITVSDLKREIKNLEYYEDFVPQLICIDYPTLLRYGNSHDEHHIALAEVWTELRGLNLEMNVAIVGAAQINRAGATVARVSDIHLAGSDGILDACTTAIGITATPQEKSMGLSRASQLKERDTQTIADEVVVLSCLDLSHWGYDSRFLAEVDYSFNRSEEKG